MTIVQDKEADWAAPLAGAQRDLIGAHFLLLNRLLRKSARGAYSDCGDANIVERRLALALHRLEEARVSELAILLGNDVAQVSRALTAMRAKGLVARKRQRDPYSLTAEGVVLGRQLDAVARVREERLTAGLQPHQMFEFAGQLAYLMRNASAILADEIAQSRDEASAEEAACATTFEIPSRVQPAIANLATVISRTATAAFKRLAGISNYEWRILVNIAARPGITFMGLVNHVESDKAQVSRALDQLECAGLIVRAREERGDPAHFDLTAEGQRVYEIMRQDAMRRNAILIADLPAVQRRRLKSYLEALIVNAMAMAGHDT